MRGIGLLLMIQFQEVFAGGVLFFSFKRGTSPATLIAVEPSV
jgi:hypothetical protein